MSSRSYEQLTETDLRKLGEIVARDRANLFKRRIETGRLYGNRLFAVALCQGAALHYLDGKNGIKDLDVWSFFRANPERDYPNRRRGQLDFGDPRFGRSDDAPNFIGRRVDHMGRALMDSDYSDPVAVLRRYLRNQATGSARLLSKKAMILIEPEELLGTIVWPE
jgi:hypothetical protein